MCGKHPQWGFRTVLHSDRVCRAVFWAKTGLEEAPQTPGGNQVFSVTPPQTEMDGRNLKSPGLAWRNKPTGSGFVPLTVKSWRFVSSGQDRRFQNRMQHNA
jgi:hypothetical protein